MIMVKCENVKKRFPVLRGYLKETRGFVQALDGVSLDIAKGESFGLVGESGSGKTTLGKIILDVVRPDEGTVSRSTEKIQAVFQDPYNSLDPKMKVGDIIAEGLLIKGQGGMAKGQVEETLDLVRLPGTSIHKYPHEFSGGERQRIAIARAIVTRPELIILDEPVSSLDVTIQLQILKLLKEIREKFSMTYLFISHDLRVVRFMCDRIAVMREGKVVEEAIASKIYSNPSHPYTKLLLSSILEIY